MTDAEHLDRAREVLTIEIEALDAVRTQLDQAFADLVSLCLDTLSKGGRLVLCGVGKSGHVGQKLAATLSSTGSPAAFLHPVEAMHGDLGILGPDDLLMALSYSGETDELLALLPAAKRLGVPIVAVTGDTGSRLSGWADLTLPMTVPREACPFNLAPTATTTALMALGDALAMVLLDAQGFQKSDYARFHPAGAIGRAITLRVTDIMRSGECFATVSPETPVSEAILAMTRTRSGAVAVVDPGKRLLGIFTDGDFRRHIVSDSRVMERAIGEVMTTGAVTIPDTAMAVEVMRILEVRKIDDILVVDHQGRAVGLVDTQDLPRFKLM